MTVGILISIFQVEDNTGYFPVGSLGLAYSPTRIVDFYGKLVGKYTSPMDPVRLLGYLVTSTKSTSPKLSGKSVVSLKG